MTVCSDATVSFGNKNVTGDNTKQIVFVLFSNPLTRITWAGYAVSPQIHITKNKYYNLLANVIYMFYFCRIKLKCHENMY